MLYSSLSAHNGELARYVWGDGGASTVSNTNNKREGGIFHVSFVETVSNVLCAICTTIPTENSNNNNKKQTTTAKYTPTTKSAQTIKKKKQQQQQQEERKNRKEHCYPTHREHVWFIKTPPAAPCTIQYLNQHNDSHRQSVSQYEI